MDTPGTIFTLGGIRLTAYGLIAALGLFAGYYLAQRQASARGIKDSALQKAYFFALMGALILARCAYVLSNMGFYRSYPASALRLWEGGYSIFGGILGAVIGARLGAGRRGFLEALDTLTPPMLLTLAIWRLGELTTWQGRGMMLGDSALGFPLVLKNSQGLDCLAVCVYEAVLALLLCAYSMRRSGARPSGDRSMISLMLLGLCQVPLESMRTDEFLEIGFVKVDQLLAMAIAVTMISKFARGYLRSERNERTGYVALALSAAMIGMCIAQEFHLDGSANPAMDYALLGAYALIMAACGWLLRTGWRAAYQSGGAQERSSSSIRDRRIAPVYYPAQHSDAAREAGQRTSPASSYRAILRPGSGEDADPFRVGSPARGNYSYDAQGGYRAQNAYSAQNDNRAQESCRFQNAYAQESYRSPDAYRNQAGYRQQDSYRAQDAYRAQDSYRSRDTYRNQDDSRRGGTYRRIYDTPEAAAGSEAAYSSKVDAYRRSNLSSRHDR